MTSSMGRSTLACGVLALALACAGAEERDASVRAAAHAALARGDAAALRKALAELREAPDRDPEALLDVAALLVQAGEAPEAVWRLEAGVARFPDAAELRLALGRAALLVRSPALARDTLAGVPPTSPLHLDALLVGAQAELELGDAAAGFARLADAERLHPDDPRVAAARLAALLRERRYAEASELIARAKSTALSPAEARQLELLAARIEAAQGDREAALARLAALVESDPDDAVALALRVRALLEAGRAEQALAEAQRAAAREPPPPGVAAIRAQAWLELGRFAEAEGDLRAFASESDSPSAALLLAALQAQQGERERVVETFRAAVQRFPTTPALRLHLAEALLDAGQPEAARGELAAFEGSAPGDPHAEYLRARLELAGGDAAAAAQRLRELVPRLDRSYTQHWLGAALEASGDAVDAERRYGLALQRDPGGAASLVALLRMAEARGDRASVARRALELAQRSPGDRDAHATAIAALVRAEQFERAEPLARQYRTRFGDGARARALLALVLRAGGKLDAAQQELAEAGRLFGEDAEIEAEQGMLAAARGDLDAAVTRLERAIQLAPEVAQHHAALAALRFARGEAEAGAGEVDRALALAPLELAPLELRSRYRASHGDRAGAREDAQRLLAARPRDANAQFLVGALLAAEGDGDGAIAAYRRAAELDPRAAAPRNNLALLLARRGEPAAALDEAQRAYALAPDDPEIADTLGWLYVERGLADRGVQLLERAHAAAPERGELQIHLALAYQANGRPADARRELEALRAHVPRGSALGEQTDAALQSLRE